MARSGSAIINELSTVLEPPEKVGAYNIGFRLSTTTYTNDTLNLVSADGTDLGADNPAHIVIDDSANPGQTVTFTLTVNKVLGSIDAAHWNLEGVGTVNDYTLHMYIANDAGTPKFVLHTISGLKRLLATNDETVASNLTTLNKFFIDVALTGDADVLEIGWVKADFDDSLNRFTFLDTAGDIGIGIAQQGSPKPFFPTIQAEWDSKSSSIIGYWWKTGSLFGFSVRIQVSSQPLNALTLSLPIGLSIDGIRHINSAGNDTLGTATFADQSAGVIMSGVVGFGGVLPVLAFQVVGADVTLVAVGNTVPFVWANIDQVYTRCDELPITGW